MTSKGTQSDPGHRVLKRPDSGGNTGVRNNSQRRHLEQIHSVDERESASVSPRVFFLEGMKGAKSI